MADEIDISELADEPEPVETRYTAFEFWEYRQLLYPQEHPQSWIDLAESFYHAAEVIVDGVVEGKLFEDIHGVAGIFAFRHFLELSLKGIVGSGRWLVEPHVNATPIDFKAVQNEHNLRVLWNWVLRDARPKLESQYWENFDTPFVEKCIAEFDNADAKSFAWRYPRQGSERYRYDFAAIRHAMRHVRLVLDGIKNILNEMYAANAEWEAELRSMAD